MADDVRVYPTTLARIVKEPEHRALLAHVAHNINIVYTNASALLNLFAINAFQNDPPKLLLLRDASFMRKIFGVCVSGYASNKVKPEDKPIIQELYDLFNEHIRPHVKDEWILSETYHVVINSYLATQLDTNLKVNVKEHFVQRTKAFVNKLLCDTKSDKVLRDQLKLVKQDLLYGTNNADPKFHDFVSEHRPHILPIDMHPNGIAYDIQVDPVKYLYGTMYMNAILERDTNEYVSLSKCLPLRTAMCSHFIPLDFQILTKIFGDDLVPMLGISRSELLKSSCRELIFDAIFDLSRKEFADKRFQGTVKRVFDYLIYTDGISARVVFRTISSQNKRRGDGFNTRTKNAKIDSRQCRKTSGTKFQYLSALTKKQRKELSQRPFTAIDPGKNDLFHACHERDGGLEYFSYSTRRKRVEDYTIRRRELIPRIKYSLGILPHEQLFARKAGRGRYSVDLGRFSTYLAHKYAYMRAVEGAYAHQVWNKLAWRGFIRKDQTRNRIVNEFARCAGSDAIIGVGDWSHKSRTHLKNSAPTLGIGLLRLLRRRFEHVYLIDEYKTSVSCSACHALCENSVYTKKVVSHDKDGNPRFRRVHKILRCTNENCRIYWQRDVNGSSNIHSIGKSILAGASIPECFSRPSRPQESTCSVTPVGLEVRSIKDL
jgi:hypothetical protein